jgi:Polyketide cyclase / dehydrase and lipid transport
MKPLICTHRSSASPDRVWAVASDFANAAGRSKAITKVEIVTSGPVGSGTRFREWRGRQVVDMEVAAWSPPRSYSLRGYAMGTEFTSEIRCVPDGSGTRLEMEVHVRPRTFGAKLLSPLISVMSKMMVKSCAKDLGDIAAAAEGDAKGERGRAAVGTVPPGR